MRIVVYLSVSVVGVIDDKNYRLIFDIMTVDCGHSMLWNALQDLAVFQDLGVNTVV
jgi:hypothetical protein